MASTGFLILVLVCRMFPSIVNESNAMRVILYHASEKVGFLPPSESKIWSSKGCYMMDTYTSILVCGICNKVNDLIKILLVEGAPDILHVSLSSSLSVVSSI